MNFQRIAMAGLLGLAAASVWPTAQAQDIAAAEPGIVPMDPRSMALLSEAPQAPPVSPAIRTDEHGTRYVSGGVSLEERELMSEMARGFPLRIVSARPDSALVPGIGVDIRDARGRQVLALSEAGPVIYVALPPGRYKLTLNNGGAVQTRQISVAGGQQREVSVFWAGQPEEYALLQALHGF